MSLRDAFRFDSLYFGDTVPELIAMAAVEPVTETDLALPIPLYVRFKARGFPGWRMATQT